MHFAPVPSRQRTPLNLEVSDSGHWHCETSKAKGLQLQGSTGRKSHNHKGYILQLVFKPSGAQSTAHRRCDCSHHTSASPRVPFLPVSDCGQTSQHEAPTHFAGEMLSSGPTNEHPIQDPQIISSEVHCSNLPQMTSLTSSSSTNQTPHLCNNPYWIGSKFARI